MPAGQAQGNGELDHQRDLSWVADVLLGIGSSATVSLSRRVPPGHHAIMSFRALPRASRPYVLVPEGSPRSAAEALRRLGNPAGKGKRFVEALVATGIATGLPLRLLPGRLHLTTKDGGGSEDGGTIVDHLREVLGIEDLSIAVILGDSRRPNRKPVLRLVGPTGDTVAFAKVGWNELSRELVRNEGVVLRVLGAGVSRPSSFDVPSLLHAGVWRGMEVVVVSAAPRDRWWHDGPPIDLPVSATREVAELGVGTKTPLAESSYWKRTIERIERTAADSDAGRGLTMAAERIAHDDGATEMTFGRWHGDWTPWNMSLVDGRLFVWDWERSEEDVPVGLDAAHFDFEVRAKIKGEPPDRAIHRSLLWIAPVLQKLGIDRSLAPLVARLHLVEMNLRFQEGQATGLEVRDAMYLSALRELLVAAGRTPV